MALSPGLGFPYPWLRELKPEQRGLCLIHLLLSCANHVATGSIDNANVSLEHISHLASPTGDTMQRIAAYFAEAFADRLLRAWQPGLHKALNCTKMSSVSEQILVQKLFFDLLPFLKLSYLVTNQATMEAIEGEKMVHIIDLHSCESAQWISLLQALSVQPEGPPHLRITGIHEKKEVLDQMAMQLNKEAEKLDIAFQFNPIVSKLDDLDVESLRVKTGEALVISSVLQLHSLLALDEGSMPTNAGMAYLERVFYMKPRKLEDLPNKDLMKMLNSNEDSTSSSSSSPIPSSNSSKLDASLKALLGLSPKLVVVTEQESNHNGSALMERVIESLNFYAALFDCLESTTSRASIERQKLEKLMFGEEIKNITACEGAERKARHEKLSEWVQRFESVGFRREPLSCHGVLLARRNDKISIFKFFYPINS
ncbi:hypothetical protein Cgig2_000174 [Carnegiea gigantea]|uniref:Scarecrow-like protein 3 n=1 Tax=Carnegiea gigantea TaxID=171969 RepID=A0A9Q1KNI9_9CARY|nr:hypothetical protein Cgig2_000174 [Carnegiea gigantea]